MTVSQKISIFSLTVLLSCTLFQVKEGLSQIRTDTLHLHVEGSLVFRLLNDSLAVFSPFDPYLFDESTLIIAKRDQRGMIPCEDYRAHFVKGQDTMKILMRYRYGGHDWIDSIPFLKGDFTLTVYSRIVPRQVKKGAELFQHSKTLGNVIVKYISTPFSGEDNYCKPLVELEFMYYSVGQPGVSLEPTKFDW